jgi:hypothetical protein
MKNIKNFFLNLLICFLILEPAFVFSELLNHYLHDTFQGYVLISMFFYSLIFLIYSILFSLLGILLRLSNKNIIFFNLFLGLLLFILSILNFNYSLNIIVFYITIGILFELCIIFQNNRTLRKSMILNFTLASAICLFFITLLKEYYFFLMLLLVIEIIFIYLINKKPIFGKYLSIYNLLLFIFLLLVIKDL